MKLFLALMAATTAGAFAQTSSYVNFIRQKQQSSGVVWDMPVAAIGQAPSALALDSSGALFELWTINKTKSIDHLLDQKLVGAYMPSADIKVITLDKNGKVPRTRVDQPFSVEIDVAGLLTGAGFPVASSKVLLEQHIASYVTDGVMDPAKVIANVPAYSGFISSNGKTVLKFPAASLKATDPTKARGEEYFVVHALTDDTISQTQIASNFVQVWPVASGSIKGIANGDVIRFNVPTIELTLTDLYPRSDSYFMLYKGSSVNGVEGTVVMPYPVDRDIPLSTVLNVTGLDSKFKEDGTYTVALMSETVFGKELLCAPITFEVKRTLQVNAMQVNMTDGATR